MNDVEIDRIRQRMLQQAFLFDDPHAYRCGVEDALTAVTEAEHRATDADVRAAPAVGVYVAG